MSRRDGDGGWLGRNRRTADSARKSAANKRQAVNTRRAASLKRSSNKSRSAPGRRWFS